MQEVAGRLFGADPQNSLLIAAPLLASESARAEFVQSIEAGQAGFVYFLDKLGGEISIPPTDRSPELSFDLTLVEVQATAGGSLRLGKYGIMEIQTMDFHGSYRHVVNNLRDALRLHQDGFHQAVQDNPHWLSEQIEGPNIANVFKRTFYQMALKFQIGADEASAGCVLAIPLSVWDSWQRHLGRPDLSLRTDGTYVLAEGPDADTSGRIPAWIYVFDLDVSKAVTPDEIRIDKVIATDAEAVAHFALKVAPQAAVAGVGSSDRVLSTIRQRIAEWWPALAGKSVMP